MHLPCTRPNSQFLTVGLQLSLGADFDMELLLCALTKFSAERKGADEILCATGLAGRFRTLPGRCPVNTMRCWLF